MTDSEPMTPRERIQGECRSRGTPALVAGCIDLLEGRDADDGLILALGGEPARYVLAGGEGGRDGYWPRVWAARGLLHAWDDRAAAAIIGATADDAWRVREMAARVVARHRVDDALSAMAGLQDDDVPRVRQAAGRAIAALTASGA
ncbi:MAG TPA: HEAT repeat domain-containing protein [Streptosporangiaceae bacterium]|nr:HEAT repeat domain-containing protein [Streptosporangiaceae bacterium]